jgi:hypothetical protein
VQPRLCRLRTPSRAYLSYKGEEMKRTMQLLLLLLLVFNVFLPTLAQYEEPAPLTQEDFAIRLPDRAIESITRLRQIPSGEIILNKAGILPNLCELKRKYYSTKCEPHELEGNQIGLSRISNGMARGMFKAYNFRGSIIYTQALVWDNLDTEIRDFLCHYNESCLWAAPPPSNWYITQQDFDDGNRYTVTFTLPTALQNCHVDTSGGYADRLSGDPGGNTLTVLHYDISAGVWPPATGEYVYVNCTSEIGEFVEAGITAQ